MAQQFKKRTADADWLDGYIASLQAFRKYNPDVTANQIISFLAVARESNITQKEVFKDILGLKSSGQSRIIALLGEYGDRDVPGWKVLRTEENPLDRREKLINLTPTGELLLQVVRGHIERMCNKLCKLMEAT